MNEERVDEFEPERFGPDEDSDYRNFQNQFQDEERVGDCQPDEELVEVLVGLDQAQCDDGQQVSGQSENSENENTDAFDPEMSTRL